MIYLASVEVEPLSGCQMPAGQIAAFVYVLIPAGSKREATQKLRAALKEDRYGIIDLEFVAKYGSFSWEKEEDQIEYDRLAKRAALHNDVVYGTFYSWTNPDSSA